MSEQLTDQERDSLGKLRWFARAARTMLAMKLWLLRTP